MKIIIRNALFEDVPAITKGAKEIAKELGLFCLQPSELEQEDFKRAIESSQGIFLVAE